MVFVVVFLSYRNDKFLKQINILLSFLFCVFIVSLLD